MNSTRIGELRRARGWTQERLGTESGVAARTIQRLEAGHDASLETIALIADALGVPVRDLVVPSEHGEFGEGAEGLEERKRAQQARRDGTTHGYGYLFRGIGLLVIFATIAIESAGMVSWIGWLIIPAYWAGGRLLSTFLFRLVIDPRLDDKYPLSVPSRVTTDN